MLKYFMPQSARLTWWQSLRMRVRWWLMTHGWVKIRTPRYAPGVRPVPDIDIRELFTTVPSLKD